MKIKGLVVIASLMDKLHLPGLNQGRVFNSRSGTVHTTHFYCYRVKLPDLKLKIRTKLLLGPLLLDNVLLAALKIFVERMRGFVTNSNHKRQI
jgi:hypothetical protein